jgi:hypothetical protein
VEGGGIINRVRVAFLTESGGNFWGACEGVSKSAGCVVKPECSGERLEA